MTLYRSCEQEFWGYKVLVLKPVLNPKSTSFASLVGLRKLLL